MSKPTPDINKILALPENTPSSKYGAQMGRRNQWQGEYEKLYLQKVRFVDGDYDTGGVYWGRPPPGENLYCAFSHPTRTQNDVPIEIFVRARNRTQAIALVREELDDGDNPAWKFHGEPKRRRHHGNDNDEETEH